MGGIARLGRAVGDRGSIKQRGPFMKDVRTDFADKQYCINADKGGGVKIPENFADVLY